MRWKNNNNQRKFLQIKILIDKPRGCCNDRLRLDGDRPGRKPVDLHHRRWDHSRRRSIHAGVVNRHTHGLVHRPEKVKMLLNATTRFEIVLSIN